MGENPCIDIESVIYFIKLRVEETTGGVTSGSFKNDINSSINSYKYHHYSYYFMSGAIAGASDTYWSKHKDRSMEGVLVKATRALVALFLILSIVLNIGSF